MKKEKVKKIKKHSAKWSKTV